MITPKYELNEKVIAIYGRSSIEATIIGCKITKELNNVETCSYFLVGFPISYKCLFCKLFENEIRDWLNSQYIMDIQFVSDIYNYIGEPTCWFAESKIIRKIEENE